MCRSGDLFGAYGKARAGVTALVLIIAAKQACQFRSC